ncbi:MAG: segregation and condensation protein A, partial [Gammaproteobacteria bacterium]
SRMLLPRPTAGALEEDPRAELVRRLLEYEQMKLAAQRLNELPQSGRDFSMVQVLFDQAVAERLPEVRAEDLRAAWLTLLTRAAMNRHHRITREQLSVREHMTRILRRLHDTRFVEFGKLFDPRQGIALLVVTLLAVLELAREGLIEVTQQAPYAPIHVRLKTGHLMAVE